MGFTGLKFEAETEESRSYTGLSNCLTGGLGSGCFLFSRAACNFYRVWYIPDLLKSFEVSKITGYKCQYNIVLEHLQNSSLTQITVQDTTQTASGIEITVLGSYDQAQLFLNENLVQRMAN